MAVALALASAALIGSGDFLGGLASRRQEAGTAVTAVYLVGIPTLVVVSPFVAGSPTAADLAWGAGSGAAGAIGLWALYQGFARGRVAVVSPLAAVIGAAVPVAVGLATGDDPGTTGLAGLAIGLVAVVLVTRPRGADSSAAATGVVYGIAAGVPFAGMFLMLSFTGDNSGLWPVLPSRIVGVAVLLLVLRRMPRVPRATLPAVIFGGLFSVLGNGAFLLSTQEGDLAVVTVLTSLYPAVTVMWARTVFQERLSPAQVLGLGAALAAVTLLSV